MKVLILNASPKRRGGASKFFSTLLRPFLLGCQIQTLPLHGGETMLPQWSPLLG